MIGLIIVLLILAIGAGVAFVKKIVNDDIPHINKCTIIGDNGEVETTEVSFTLFQWLRMTDEDRKHYQVQINDNEIKIQPK